MGKSSVDMKVVEDKIAKGEKLTPEETKEVMSAPPEGYEKHATEEEGEDIFKEAEDVTKGAKLTDAEKEALAAKKEADEKVAQEAEDKDAQDADAAAKAKKEAEEKAAAGAGEAAAEDVITRLNKELDKPEGQEDLKGFNDREKAYFWQMRRDRRARQKAEQERDTIRLERAKEKAVAEAEAKKKADAKAEDEFFKDRDETDFITVSDVKKLLESANKKEQEAGKAAPAGPDPMQVAYLRMCDKEAAKDLSDYAEVMACVDEVFTPNAEYQKEIIDELRKGENIAVAIYNKIKGDPEFPKVLEKLKASGKIPAPAAKPISPEAQKKIDEAKAAQKKLEDNKNKPKTSGHSGGDSGSSGAGEITADQLFNMSQKEFEKIPKAQRDKLLRELGV